MASPFVRFFSKNSVHVNGNPLRADSAYWLYFRRLYPQLPRLHMMYGSDSQIRGIPLAELMHGSYTQNNKERYRDAAEELVTRVTDMYQLSTTKASVLFVNLLSATVAFVHAPPALVYTKPAVHSERQKHNRDAHAASRARQLGEIHTRV